MTHNVWEMFPSSENQYSDLTCTELSLIYLHLTSFNPVFPKHMITVEPSLYCILVSGSSINIVWENTDVKVEFVCLGQRYPGMCDVQSHAVP